MSPVLIAVRLRDRTEAIQTVRRIWTDGDAVLPLDPDAPERVVAERLRLLRPAALVHARPDGRTRVTRLDDAVALPNGTGVVVATSGSTGAPKGIVLSRDAMRASAEASIARLGCQPGQRWLLDLPLHHVAGLQVLVRSDVLGTDPALPAAEASSMHSTQRGTPRADWVAWVPTQLERALRDPVDLRGVGVLLGGAAVSDDVLERAAAAGATVVRSYGMTETCGGCVYDGRPLDGVDVSIGDAGMIRLRGPMLASGVREADGTITPLVSEDGWYETSDIGRYEDGVLEVLGRADNVIVTGGENVAAEAVENALRRHPGVRDAAVHGEPDPEWGQRVVASVVVATTPPPSEDELRAHVAGELGRHTAPKSIRFVDELPRTTLGKLDREGLGLPGH